MIIQLTKPYLGLAAGAELTVDATTANTLVLQGVAVLISIVDGVNKISVELTRPADTTNYTALDAMLGAAAPVKKKYTITVSGAFGTATISGAGGLTKTLTFTTDVNTTTAGFQSANVAAYAAVGITLTNSTNTIVFEATTAGVDFDAPVMSSPASDVAGTVTHTTANVTAVKQKETLTLTGAYGTAVITAAGGLSPTITFGVDLTTTAATFKAANVAGYLAVGIVLTNVSDTLVFEANVAGTPFDAPLISGVAGDLAGTVAHTTANRAAVAQVDRLTFTGSSGSARVAVVGGLTKDTIYAASLTQTCTNFVTNHTAAYTAVGITVTSGVGTLTFTANVAGTPLAQGVVEAQTGNLAGTWASVTPNTTPIAQVEIVTPTGAVGHAAIAAAGGLTRYIQFITDFASSVDAFVSANAAAYLAQAIVLSRTGNTLVMTANVAGTGFTAPTITNIAGITGTIAHTTANRIAVKQVEDIALTGTIGKATVAAAGSITALVTFNTSLRQSWEDFITANTGAYTAAGITLTAFNEVLTMTSTVAGTAFTAPTITNKVNVTGAVVLTLANTTLTPLVFTLPNNQSASGTRIVSVKAGTNMTMFAAKTVRLWMFSDLPTGIVADNVTFIISYANIAKLEGYLDIVFDAVLGSSDMVYGKVLPSPAFPVSTAAKTLYILPQSVDAVTAPSTGGKMTFTLYTEN